MSLLKRINKPFHIDLDTGFGVNASDHGGRFINKDGSYNISKQGLQFWDRVSIYTSMLTMPIWKFLSVIGIFYILINLLFATIYYLIGIHTLIGVASMSAFHNFMEAFFFSAQTLTTVGYGRVSPSGILTNSVAALESLIGLLSLALATGIFYGKFTRPNAHILFSRHALISPYQDKTALMFRMVPFKEKHHLTDVEIRVTLGLTLEIDHQPTFKFYPLKLERNRLDALSMNWTIVHPIDENSPILGFSLKDLETGQAEFIVQLRGFSHIYSNTVQRATSYTYQEIIPSAKFLPMYHESPDGKTTILELDKLDAFQEAKLPD
ncbi:MAG: ion channel [Chitinophagaceae bacterium]